MGIGELAGLAAAAFWACSSLFYTRTPLTAWQMNFGKNVLASLLLLTHLMIVTQSAGRPMFAADARTVLALALSSVIGILIGDTFYFRSLQLLGPPKALVVSTTSPLFATVIGWVVLQEQLSWTTLGGILLTLVGVAVVISDRPRTIDEPSSPLPAPDFDQATPNAVSQVLDHQPRHPGWSGSISQGLAAGITGAVLNATGATFSRLGTSGSAVWKVGGCDPLEATVIRVAVAGVSSILTALLLRQLATTSRTAFSRKALRCYFPAVVCGPWMGIWMSQIAYKNSPLAVALTLTCTSPVFVIPLSRALYGTAITLRGLAGTSVALVGVYFTVAG
jgi:drug/metabolite transporter (DMT)-like permease